MSSEQEFYTNLSRLWSPSSKSFSIDPGVRNFGFSSLESLTHLCLDYDSFANLERNLPKLFRSLFAVIDPSTAVFYIENQRASCQNQRIEWLTRGILHALGAGRVIGVAPFTRNKWCRLELDWTYVKCSTRKAFKLAHDTNPKFRQLVTGWKRYHINIPALQLKATQNIFELAKSDEFVDTVLLLAINARKKVPRQKLSSNEPRKIKRLANTRRISKEKTATSAAAAATYSPTTAASASTTHSTATTSSTAAAARSTATTTAAAARSTAANIVARWAAATSSREAETKEAC